MKCIVCGGRNKLSYKNLFDDRYGAPGLYSIYCCAKCGFGRTSPILKRKRIGDFYKKYYPLSFVSADEIKNSVNIPSPFLAWLNGLNSTAYWHVEKDSDVLDIGSGSGASLLEIEKLGANAYGVEPDPTAQIIAKKLKLRVYKGFISDDPFPDVKFNFITANQVFEHEPNPLEFLRLATGKLKKGGRVIISVPNFNSIYLRIFGNSWLNWHVPYHINFFTRTTFEKLSKREHYRIVGIKTITPNNWTLIQLITFFKKTKPGKKSPFWATVKARGQRDNHPLNFKSVTLHLGAILFSIFITPINRLIDLFGVGDCLLVILEN